MENSELSKLNFKSILKIATEIFFFKVGGGERGVQMFSNTIVNLLSENQLTGNNLSFVLICHFPLLFRFISFGKSVDRNLFSNFFFENQITS